MVLMAYTFTKLGSRAINRRPIREYITFLLILVFYIVYSLLMAVNVSEAVWLDLVQQIRPYSVLYCTWILAPTFSKGQRNTMLAVMIVTLISWIVYHPQTTKFEAEFPVLGQLSICTGMAYYLFTKETKANKYIALAIVCAGLMAPKMKFVGEVVCFVALLFFIKQKLNMKSPKTLISLATIMALCIAFTWTRFDGYYVSGWDNKELARPMTYKTSVQIIQDYFPFGPGMGTFAVNAARVYYSPLYPKYELDGIWGLTSSYGGFIMDAFYPTLAQFGIVGVFLFLWFWKRRLKGINAIQDMRYYHVALMAFFCLAIESTADTSYLSGKGMGFFMLIAICLNANRVMGKQR